MPSIQVKKIDLFCYFSLFLKLLHSIVRIIFFVILNNVLLLVLLQLTECALSLSHAILPATKRKQYKKTSNNITYNEITKKSGKDFIKRLRSMQGNNKHKVGGNYSKNVEFDLDSSIRYLCSVLRSLINKNSDCLGL